MNDIAKDLLTVCAAFAVGLCSSGCEHQGKISQYADRVPAALGCGPLDGSRGAPLVTLALKQPDEFLAEVEERLKVDTEKASCELLDAAAALMSAGKRYPDARKLVNDTLEDLGLAE